MEQIQSQTQWALVIEDEIPLAGIFAKALKFAGYQTGEIYDGQEALDHLRESEEVPSLVLLDFHLPLVSGKEILQFIRGDQRFSKTRVIMATSDSAAMVGEIEKKADLVLLKPISYWQLRELAARFLY
ncbi:MAG: response regulator, partial [Anaerolineaceae bacterium]|nr:response regulator [Anaerolineaceae bacterium]